MKIKRFLPQILLFLLFVSTFAVSSQITLMGDDFYYATFIKNNFWELHKNHYLEINGRAIVHFLDSIFLTLPTLFWAFLNSFMLTGITYFGSKIIELFVNKKEGFLKSIIIFIFGILTLNIYVIRQSVYWITGSFNYVYPIFMLFWYWYVLLKNSKVNFSGNKLLYTSLLAFFASATVEQGGMMSFGATVLFFIYSMINNKNNSEKYSLKRISIILIFSFFGIASVIFSPAQFIRFGLEKQENISLLASAKNCIIYLIYTYITKYTYNILLAFLASAILFKQRKKIEIFNKEQIYLLVTTIILGIGSQIMMIVSPEYGERNTLFGIFMITFFTAIIISKLPEYKKLIFVYIKNLFYVLLILISIIYFAQIFANYKVTNIIQKENEKIIYEYKHVNSSKPLQLYKLKNDNFGWSMPYISKYHENWLKIYYGITNTEIIWQGYIKE